MDTWHYTLGTKVTNRVSNFSSFRAQTQRRSQNSHRRKYQNIFLINDLYCFVVF
uniref:Uncharacterized protein n=1 Tax=Solanum lycopersicum TaxID=4081 RepID=A0A3Q7HDW1_SOLLC